MKKILMLFAACSLFFACNDDKDDNAGGNGGGGNGGGTGETYDFDIKAEDGFFAYDGLDEASGHYRTSVMLSSKSMSEENTDGYTDILIYIYTSFEPEIVSQTGGYTFRKFFTGAITPFYTTGSGLTDQMWYIGKHFTDEEGENVQGCGWFTYDKDGNTTACYAADDTEKTTCEIVENEDGTHTIKGVMYDKTLGKTLRYEYTTDDPGIFSPNFGE